MPPRTRSLLSLPRVVLFAAFINRVNLGANDGSCDCVHTQGVVGQFIAHVCIREDLGRGHCGVLAVEALVRARVNRCFSAHVVVVREQEPPFAAVEHLVALRGNAAHLTVWP